MWLTGAHATDFRLFVYDDGEEVNNILKIAPRNSRWLTREQERGWREIYDIMLEYPLFSVLSPLEFHSFWRYQVTVDVNNINEMMQTQVKTGCP